MAKVIVVGAPSLTGGGLAHQLAEALAGVVEVWPAEIEVENRFPFPYSLPEVGRMYLQQVADRDNCRGRGFVSSLADITNLVTNIEAVAEAHGTPEAVILTFGFQDAPAQEEPLPDLQEAPAIPPSPAGEGEDAGDSGAESGSDEKASEEAPQATEKRRGRPPKSSTP